MFKCTVHYMIIIATYIKSIYVNVSVLKVIKTENGS